MLQYDISMVSLGGIDTITNDTGNATSEDREEEDDTKGALTVSGISVSQLDAALREAEDVKFKSRPLLALLSASKAVYQLRTAMQQRDWHF